MSVELGCGHVESANKRNMTPGAAKSVASAEYTILPVPGLYPIPKVSSYCRRTLNRAGHNCLVKALKEVVMEITSCIQKYRVGLGIITIVGCVCLLAMPQVPERFLGIRSPQRVLMEYRLTPHPGNDSVLHPVEVNQSHSIHKRNIRVPHKYWAKARPHNKFKKKKKRSPHHVLAAPPERPAGPVPNPHLIKMKY